MLWSVMDTKWIFFPECLPQYRFRNDYRMVLSFSGKGRTLDGATPRNWILHGQRRFNAFESHERIQCQVLVSMSNQPRSMVLLVLMS